MLANEISSVYWGSNNSTFPAIADVSARDAAKLNKPNFFIFSP